jgi:hypothetical protein
VRREKNIFRVFAHVKQRAHSWPFKPTSQLAKRRRLAEVRAASEVSAIDTQELRSGRHGQNKKLPAEAGAPFERHLSQQLLAIICSSLNPQRFIPPGSP